MKSVPRAFNAIIHKKHNLAAYGVLKWNQNDPKMVIQLSQMVLPHPHPRRQQKFPARGQHKLEKNKCLMMFYDFYENVKKVPCLEA